MEPIQNQTVNTETGRAKQIDTGATPLSLSNVLLGLPTKPTTIVEGDRTGVSAKSWAYQDLIGQWRLMSDILVTPSSQGIIWQLQNSWHNILSNLVRTPMNKLFCLKSWTLNIKFQFQTSFQQLGQFVVFYSNLPQSMISYHFNLKSKTDPNPFENYMVQTQLPHTKIPMGECCDVDAKISWNSPFKSGFGVDAYNYVDTTDQVDTLYDMGTLYLAIPWKMQVATGVTPSASVRIWASLSDITYSGYAPNDNSL